MLHPDEERRPFVLVPAAGGMAAGYRQLAEDIGSDQPLFVYEQWGLATRRRPDRTMEATATRYVEDLRSKVPHGPYVLIGHSFGGLVVHEMGRMLRDVGEDVSLVLLDTRRPHGRRRERRRELIARHSDSFPKAMARRVYWALFPYVDVLSYRHRADRRNHRFYRRGIRVSRGYRGGVFGGPMLVVEVPGSRAGESWVDEPGLVTRRVSGGHNSMIWSPHAKQVSDAIHQFLARDHEVVGSKSNDNEMSPA